MMASMATLDSHDRIKDPAQKSRVRRACATNPCTGLSVNWNICSFAIGHAPHLACKKCSIEITLDHLEIHLRVGARTFADIESIFEIVSTVHNRALLTVTSTIPMPKQGEPGNGAYLVTEAFSEAVGNTVVVPVSSITLPEGRYPQVGDVLFSSITRGVLATIQSISWIGTPSVTILTRQNYALQPLKALLDVVSKTTPSGGGANLETIDHVWSLPKSNVPLPAGYEYRPGDFVFTRTHQH